MCVKGFKFLGRSLVGCIVCGFFLEGALVADEVGRQEGSVSLMVDDPAYQNFLIKLEQDKVNTTERNDSAVVVEEVLPNPDDATVMRFSASLSDSASLNKSAVFIFSQAQEKLNSAPAGIQDRIDSIDILKKTIQKGL